MTKNSDWDIPASKFNFRKDLEYGQQGEKFVQSFLDSLSGGAFEVKTDRYRNGRMAVEVEQNPFRKVDEEGTQVWKPSGINVTKAKWWVYVYTLDNNEGAFIVVSVKRLKRYIQKNKKNLKMMDFARRSNNPARGWIIEPDQVMSMMYSELYDK
jgi:hypothetical protein